MNKSTEKANYGIDAPGLARFFFLAGGSAVLCCLLTRILSIQLFWSNLIFVFFAIAAIYLLGMGSLMVYWSKVAKITGREKVLNEVSWRGDERVLDVGCGRGLMLIGAARRLTTGQAVGIDIWQNKDQSENTRDGALENARIEGVLEKVNVQTADMRAMPFAESSFDIVVSHWVVHNLDKETDRNKSLAEMVRVLKPGGKLILCDIENRDAYLKTLATLGLVNSYTRFHPTVDVVLGIVSFGSFRPCAIFASKPI